MKYKQVFRCGDGVKAASRNLDNDKRDYLLQYYANGVRLGHWGAAPNPVVNDITSNQQTKLDIFKSSLFNMSSDKFKSDTPFLDTISEAQQCALKNNQLDRLYLDDDKTLLVWNNIIDDVNTFIKSCIQCQSSTKYQVAWEPTLSRLDQRISNSLGANSYNRIGNSIDLALTEQVKSEGKGSCIDKIRAMLRGTYPGLHFHPTLGNVGQTMVQVFL